MDTPLDNPDMETFTDGSSFVRDGKHKAGYAMVTAEQVLETKALPQGTSAQLAELVALTRALELSKGQRVNIYTDSKYAYLTLHAHAAIWKERPFKTATREPTYQAFQRDRETFQFSSVQFSRSAVSDSLRPHESQHARPPCPSPTPGVHSDSHPLSL